VRRQRVIVRREVSRDGRSRAFVNGARAPRSSARWGTSCSPPRPPSTSSCCGGMSRPTSTTPGRPPPTASPSRRNAPRFSPPGATWRRSAPSSSGPVAGGRPERGLRRAGGRTARAGEEERLREERTGSSTASGARGALRRASRLAGMRRAPRRRFAARPGLRSLAAAVPGDAPLAELAEDALARAQELLARLEEAASALWRSPRARRDRGAARPHPPPEAPPRVDLDGLIRLRSRSASAWERSTPTGGSRHAGAGARGAAGEVRGVAPLAPRSAAARLDASPVRPARASRSSVRPGRAARRPADLDHGRAAVDPLAIPPRIRVSAQRGGGARSLARIASGGSSPG